MTSKKEATPAAVSAAPGVDEKSLRSALVDLESWMGTWHDASLRVGRIAADAKDAIDAATAALAAPSHGEGVPEGMVLVPVPEDMEALRSFAKTAADDESYVVPADAMSRLAMFGAVYRAKRPGWYYLTDFGRMLLAAAPAKGA